MTGPCWEINTLENFDDDKEKNKENATTKRANEPPKNLTPEEQQMVEQAAQMAAQFEKEMFLIDMIFTIMQLLEILVDVVTFYDLQSDDEWFDAGTFAGKGLVNACFTIYYVLLDNFLADETERIVCRGED